eukprot:GAHX01002301.1.p1 GENE.GAHX01002301.1~~GAHX01002301.1.p1  ORF type:complete len:1233 (+),score=240.82 GAHX01002301.1:33-3731(+)
MANEEKKDLYDFIMKLSTTSTPSKEINDSEFIYYFEEYTTKLSSILIQGNITMEAEELRFIQIMKHYMGRAITVPEIDVFAVLDKEIAFYIDFNTINKSEENMVPIWRVLFNYIMGAADQNSRNFDLSTGYDYIPRYTLNCMKSWKHLDSRFIQIILNYYFNNIFLLFDKDHFNSIESILVSKDHNEISLQLIKKMLGVIKIIYKKGYYDPKPLNKYTGILFGKDNGGVIVEKLVLKQIGNIVMSFILSCTGKYKREEASISYKSKVFKLLLGFLFRTFVGIQLLGINTEGSSIARILCAFVKYREGKLREIFINHLHGIYNKAFIYLFTSKLKKKKVFLGLAISLKELLYNNIIENLVFILTSLFTGGETDPNLRAKIKSIYKNLYIYTTHLMPESFIAFFHEDNISFKCHLKNLVVYKTEMKKLRLGLEKLTYAFPFNTPPTLNYYLSKKQLMSGFIIDETNYYTSSHKDVGNRSFSRREGTGLIHLEDSKIKDINCDLVKINKLCIYIQSIRKQALFFSEGGLVMDMQTSATILVAKNQPWGLDFYSPQDIDVLNDFLEECRLSANYFFCDNRDFKRFFKSTIESFGQNLCNSNIAWTVLFKKQLLFLKKLVSILTINPRYNNSDVYISQTKVFLTKLMEKEVEIFNDTAAPAMDNSIELIQFFGNSIFVKNSRWDILKNKLFFEKLSKPELTYNEQITVFYVLRSYMLNHGENLLFHLTLFVEKINFQVCKVVYYFLKTVLKKSYWEENRKSDVRSIFVNTLEKNKLLTPDQRIFLVKHIFNIDSYEKVKKVRRKSAVTAPDLIGNRISSLDKLDTNVKEFVLYLESNLDDLLDNFSFEKDFVFDRDYNTLDRYLKGSKNIYGDKYCSNISHYITPFEKCFNFPFFLLKCNVKLNLKERLKVTPKDKSYFYKIESNENEVTIKDCFLVYTKKEISPGKQLLPFFKKNPIIEHVYEINSQARYMIKELGIKRENIYSVRIEICPSIEPAGKYILIPNINFKLSHAYYEYGTTIFGNFALFFENDMLSDMCVIVKKSPFIIYDRRFEFNLKYYSDKEEIIVVTTIINLLKKITPDASFEHMLKFYNLGCTILDGYREYFHKEFYKVLQITSFYEMFLAEHLSFETCSDESFDLLGYFLSTSIEYDRPIELGEDFTKNNEVGVEDTEIENMLKECNNVVSYPDSFLKIKNYFNSSKKCQKKEIIKAITNCFYTHENHSKQKRYIIRWLSGI